MLLGSSAGNTPTVASLASPGDTIQDQARRSATEEPKTLYSSNSPAAPKLKEFELKVLGNCTPWKANGYLRHRGPAVSQAGTTNGAECLCTTWALRRHGSDGEVALGLWHLQWWHRLERFTAATAQIVEKPENGSSAQAVVEECKHEQREVVGDEAFDMPRDSAAGVQAGSAMRCGHDAPLLLSSPSRGFSEPDHPQLPSSREHKDGWLHSRGRDTKCLAARWRR
ncbi:hypothetical protein CSOJ01_12834 [Colletotrichum sojae]|uniref:Uncharacterized protein n=1 Tax=Colletotrichum sojae TaxID=2175907 RepID=A0A8H6IUS8_9PEZI|nr:hypothetical protein CSOJ01_12834 [Colletotrichum sojae]